MHGGLARSNRSSYRKSDKRKSRSIITARVGLLRARSRSRSVGHPVDTQEGTRARARASVSQTASERASEGNPAVRNLEEKEEGGGEETHFVLSFLPSIGDDGNEFSSSSILLFRFRCSVVMNGMGCRRARATHRQTSSSFFHPSFFLSLSP